MRSGRLTKNAKHEAWDQKEAENPMFQWSMIYPHSTGGDHNDCAATNSPPNTLKREVHCCRGRHKSSFLPGVCCEGDVAVYSHPLRASNRLLFPCLPGPASPNPSAPKKLYLSACTRSIRSIACIGCKMLTACARVCTAYPADKSTYKSVHWLARVITPIHHSCELWVQISRAIGE